MDCSLPRLDAQADEQREADQRDNFSAPPAKSGVKELDDLLGGGLDRGTSTLLIGPSGSGKSSLSTQYLRAALERGEKGLLITFDETKRILVTRTRGIGIDLEPHIESGLLELQQVDPARLSPGELAGWCGREFQMAVASSLSTASPVT